MNFKEKIAALSDRAKRWLERACSALDEGVEYENHRPSRTECRLAGLITQKPFGRIEIAADVIQAMLYQGVQQP